MKFKQLTGSRKLTMTELEKVARVKRAGFSWFLCAYCGNLKFMGSSKKYCLNCGYRTLENVEIEEVY